MQKLNKIILYCRCGFEKECAAEITDRAAQLEIFGFAKVIENSGYVTFECYQDDQATILIKKLSFRTLIFARQMFVSGDLLTNLPANDRITSIINALSGLINNAGDVRVEVPDTNEGKELAGFCRKFTVPLRQALRSKRILLKVENPTKPVIHLFFTNSNSCYVGYSLSQNNSPFYMGIPRLKFPADAPSRSTLKLEEAFHIFIPYEEWDERLKGGLNAVDLGACPGGWTYQLVKRSMMVYAIDNGPMNDKLMETGQVKHYREDGFKFIPKKHNIYWLVCDMVEKPTKVTQLIAKWLINGWCRETIFNLKLPMKKRYEEVKQNIKLLNDELNNNQINVQIQAKQLYHDREEITVHVQRIWG
ncbi:23S rRNA (cytidine(2498)-2'-O)-methyltransferase RlmM [Gilliamella sp. B2776]|uniref:23S rRNA (cytidine(2498)-2'-O)-methyltransferase RlmM n=1 Tax=unclassified Gilliamella TaxID=2685620 RepID=UPI002269DEA7|nr:MULTISPECIES: 23S rRNA (cytidine(2498)-2'-O)-methyltransferase RlmM [unclassified Gilliamella]MCX8650603.1 23S rRNA (cytidine(2498)-2'-O)-methyltransferase RlmM [Gilliamella sp. B2779]MCX8654290.1 23S rRNA (cytidine(2498)-2'-O)-methyltransferase RlmM [Gilliamella sp. B2737]MCX8656827.1 23S rRNA (cytidine(2498)-2'-O)-methyltransferase RlmM [Gilliamella sp. B2894]MCX8665529.1 23S rRNA (cytidine(2498)-2'-O)-methyltransferase RlmM [Gilliamella sp. B2887]MCX8692451.1 23S rRNA (cytidine(2498)-2'-